MALALEATHDWRNNINCCSTLTGKPRLLARSSHFVCIKLGVRGESIWRWSWTTQLLCAFLGRTSSGPGVQDPTAKLKACSIFIKWRLSTAGALDNYISASRSVSHLDKYAKTPSVCSAPSTAAWHLEWPAGHFVGCETHHSHPNLT